MTAPTKVLFLEIDAGDKFVLQNGAAEGWLPNIRSLLDRGLVGDTLAPEEFFVNGLWPSLYTGVDPAKHGVHGLTQLKTGTYDFYRCYFGEHIKRKPFWSFLSEAGQRVAILDIPLSGITEDINGIQSVEWGAHDGSGFRAWPKTFEEDVLSRFGQYPLTKSCNDHGDRPEEFIALRDALIQGVKQNQNSQGIISDKEAGISSPRSLRRVIVSDTSAGICMTQTILPTIRRRSRLQVIRSRKCTKRSIRHWAK